MIIGNGGRGAIGDRGAQHDRLFLLLLLPGAGDKVQESKRGIVEMADILAVNKADGDRVKCMRPGRITSMLHICCRGGRLDARCSRAAPNEGEASVLSWKTIGEYHTQALASGFSTKTGGNRRRAGWEALQNGLQEAFSGIRT
ncbi:MAG: hypothetical protein IPJ82_21195 [Lewinellaceae bacterium]|nr:hypothetical protein [Lewinellaceae bacterium]